MDRCSRYKCLNVYLTGWTLILDSEVRFTLDALRPLGRQIVLCLHAMALYASSTCPQSQGYRLTVVVGGERGMHCREESMLRVGWM